MAVNIGPKIGIEGEAQYRKQMQQIISQTKTLDSQYKAVTATFNKYTSAEEKAGAKSGILKQQIAQQEQALKGLQQGLAAAAQKFGQNDERTQKWARSVNEAQAKLNRMNAEMREIRTEQFQKLAQGAKAAGAAVAKVAEHVAKIGIAIGTSIVAVAGASAKFFADSVKTGMEFDEAMSNVAATMGKTVDEIQDLQEFALKMGSETAFSAKESADALNYMALAGYTAEQSMKMLPIVLNLAAAGGMDLATASDMVTDAQSALGLSTEDTVKMVDQMAQTASKSNTSVTQLGEAILTVGASARDVKGGTAEIAQVLGLLADNGIKGAEGGTHLRNILLALQNPEKKAAEQLEKLNVQVYDSEGHMRSMVDIIGDLSDAMGEMNDQEKQNTISTIFNKTDLASVNALLGTTKTRWKQLGNEIEDAEDAADKMAKTKLDNLAGDVTLFKSALEGAKIAIGRGAMPELRKWVQFGTDGINRMTAAFEKNGLNGALEEFGVLLKEALDEGFKNLPDFIGIASDIISNLVQAFTDNKDSIIEAAKTLINKLIDGIHDNAYSISSGAADLLGELVGNLTSTENLQKLLDGGLQIVRGLVDGISGHVDEILMAIPNLLQAFANELKDKEKRQEFVDSAVNFMHSFCNALINSMDTLFEVIPDLCEAIVETLTDPEVILAFSDASVQCSMAFWKAFILKPVDKEGLFTAGKGAAEEVGKGLDEDTKTKDAAGKIADDIIGEITGKGPNAHSRTSYKDAGKGVADEVGEGLGEDEMVTISVADIEKIIKEPFTNGRLFSTLRTSGGHLITGLIEGINSKARDLKKAVQDMAGIINANLHFSRPDEGPLRDYEKWMPDMITGLADSIRANTWRLRDAAVGLGAGIAGGVNPAGRSYVNNVGGISVNVYGTEGQSVDALADKVMDRINISLQDSGRVWA